jgi:hypothetical protein
MEEQLARMEHKLARMENMLHDLTEPGKPRSTIESEPVTNDSTRYTMGESLQSFRNHILPMYPFLTPSDVDGAKSLLHDANRIHVPAKRKRTEHAEAWPVKTAVALLIRRLGELCCDIERGVGGRRGWKHVTERVDIMEAQQGQDDVKLHHIIAHLLEAICCGLVGREGPAAACVNKAAALLNPILTASRLQNLGAGSAPETPEENQVLFAYWACLMMERWGCIPSFLRFCY